MATNGAAEDGASAQQRQFNDVFSSLPTTVFEEMSLLAAKHQSVNLVRSPLETRCLCSSWVLGWARAVNYTATQGRRVQ